MTTLDDWGEGPPQTTGPLSQQTATAAVKPQLQPVAEARPATVLPEDVPKERLPYFFEVDQHVPLVGHVHFTVPRFPGLTQLEKGKEWLDTKLPTIKGRPAIQECFNNLKPGITVSLVSLPLSISLAIAADATPVQGCITAVWAGLTAAVLGGSHYNIVGPTGALSGILSYFSVTYGPAIQPLLAILAGLLSLLVWKVRADKYLVFIPGSVMHGFTLGVAFIISANQLNFMLGLPKLQRHPEFLSNLFETFSNLNLVSPFAIVFFALAFGSLFNLASRYGKVPWAVVLAILGIFIGLATDGRPSAAWLQTIRTRYGDLQIQLVQGMDLSRVALNGATMTDIAGGAVSIAAVAVLETLISARIADRMTKTLFEQSREVFSVGMANLASGITGGIPATAALARTSLNVKSGATSRGAGIVNAIMIMLLSSVLFSAFKFLPLPIVAAILVNTAYRMVEWHEVHLLWRTDRASAIVMFVTMAVTVVQDPTMGIIYGTGLAMIRTLLALMHGHSSIEVLQGTQRKLAFHFMLNDGAKAVAVARARFLGLPDPEAQHKAKARMDAGAAVDTAPSSSTGIAAAARALKMAEEDAKVVAAAAASQAAGTHVTEVALGATAAAANASSAAAASAMAARHDDASATDGAAAAAAAEGAVGEGYEATYRGFAPTPEDERLPLVAVYEMPGYATYVSANSHLTRIRALFLEPATLLPGVEVVCFNLGPVHYMDSDALEALGDLVGEITRAGKVLFVLGAAPHIRRTLAKVPWGGSVVVFEDYGALLMHLREVLRMDDACRAAAASASQVAGGATSGGGSSGGRVPTLGELVVARVKDVGAHINVADTAAALKATHTGRASRVVAAAAGGAAAADSEPSHISAGAGAGGAAQQAGGDDVLLMETLVPATAAGTTGATPRTANAAAAAAGTGAARSADEWT